MVAILDSYLCSAGILFVIDSYTGSFVVMMLLGNKSLLCMLPFLVVLHEVLVMGEMIADEVILADDFLFKQTHVTIVNNVKINTVHTIATMTPIIEAKTVD